MKQRGCLFSSFKNTGKVQIFEDKDGPKLFIQQVFHVELKTADSKIHKRLENDMVQKASEGEKN